MTNHTNQTEREALRFTKKSVTIEAMQWDGTKSGKAAIEAVFPGLETCALTSHATRQEIQHWRIRTLEDGHVVSPGDWIIKGVKGEFYPCKPDIFDATYERAAIAAQQPQAQAVSDGQLLKVFAAFPDLVLLRYHNVLSDVLLLQVARAILALKPATGEQQEQRDNRAYVAGLESSIGHMSRLIDQQRTLLAEVENVCGRDGHGGQLEDGESALIDKVRAHLEMVAEPEQREPLSDWQPIETCPQDGYFLIHEDGAVRLSLRAKGEWKLAAYPSLVSNDIWNSVLVGRDAERVLKPLGYRLQIQDGCCENPTHWMPCPPDPAHGIGERT